MEPRARFEVAIVGGGIVGIMMAMGLLRRKISVKIYEQSREFREVGAGVAFTANALECMELLDPRIVQAVNAVATPNGESVENPNDYLRWHNGYQWDPEDVEGTDDKLLFLLHSGYKGFQGCHRAHLLQELIRSIPDQIVAFGKRLEGYERLGPEGRMLLRFSDGSVAEADAVIGCDGIKSKVRQLVLGSSHLSSYPTFTHKVCYRALIPMDKVETVLGSFKAHNQHMHTGPEAHILHFPVAGHTVLNFVAFVNDLSDWPLGDANTVGNMVRPATRHELEKVFGSWGPTVRSIVNLLPDNMDKWGIFDTYDHPVPTYVSGRVCLAGDAAHAASPHHGAGAGIGVEDALALCTLLEKALAKLEVAPGSGGQSRHTSQVVEQAFELYNKVRLPRCQWLVKSSREVCDVYEWVHPETQTDWEKCLADITARSHKLWYFDYRGMLDDLVL